MASVLVILMFISACAKLDEPKRAAGPRTSWLSEAAKKEARERAEKRAEVRSEVQAKVRKELQIEEKVTQKEPPAAAPQPQAPEVKPQPEAAKPQLTELNITESPEGIRVAVGSTSLLQYTSYMLESPPRLTIDIFGAGVGAFSQPMEIGKDPLKKIRAAYMEDKDITRVEIELTDKVPYEITRDKNNIVVNLPTKPAEPEPAEKPPALKVTDLRYREIEGMVRLEADFSGQNPQYKAIRLKDPPRLVLEITDAVVEKEREMKPEKTLGALKSVSLTQSEAKGRPAARIVALLTELTPYVVYQEGNTIKMDVESPSLRPIAAETPSKAQAQVTKGEKTAPAMTPKTPTLPPATEEKLKEAPTPGKPGEKYTGSKISLDFQDAELTDILRLLAEVSGLNIITGPRVSAKVNIRMQDVPWDQALNLILRSNDYDFLQEGSVLWIDLKSIIEREKETRKLEQEARAKEEARKAEEAKPTEAKGEKAAPVAKKEQYVTRIFSVNYVSTTRSGTGMLQTAKAAEGEEGGGGSTINTEDKPDIWGTITEGLNTILFGAASTETARSQEGKRLIVNKFAGIIQVSTSPDQMAEVAEFLKTVEDSFLRQVMVEAHIVEVLLSENFQMGIDWTLVGRIAGDLRGGLAGGILAQQKLIGAGVPTGVPTDLFRFAVTNENINIILDAISTQGSINTLSNPKISTLNNQKAVMKVGTEEVVFDVTTTISQGISVTSATAKTVTVGVVLDVTPHVNPDGKITMVVHPNITELLSIEREPRTGVSAPRVSTRETNTIVTLDNNQTLILTGLIRDRTEKTRIGVPFLSKVPLFGAAFRQSVKSKAKSELVIFITPTIIEGGRITELSAEQVKSLQQAPQRFFK